MSLNISELADNPTEFEIHEIRAERKFQLNILNCSCLRASQTLNHSDKVAWHVIWKLAFVKIQTVAK